MCNILAVILCRSISCVYPVPLLTYSASNIAVTMKRSLEVTENGTARKLGYSFPPAFHISYGHNL